MNLENLLEKYGLSKDTTTEYIDAIAGMNQTQTAEEIGVSRDTINRYKDAFNEMSILERAYIISSLTQQQLLEYAT